MPSIMPIAIDLYVKWPFYKKWNKKKSTFFFLLKLIHDIWGANSYILRNFKSQGTVFFKCPQFTTWLSRESPSTHQHCGFIEFEENRWDQSSVALISIACGRSLRKSVQAPPALSLQMKWALRDCLQLKSLAIIFLVRKTH